MTLQTCLKVNINNYKIFNFIIIGIGLIKKASKNQIELLPNFNDFYFNDHKNIIELNEENKKDNKKIMKLKKLNKEINHIKYLIENINELSLFYQVPNNINDDFDNNIINNGKSLTIPYKDLLQLNDDKNKNVGFIAAKSETNLKFELAHVNDPKNITEQKKCDMNFGKLQYNDEYLNLSRFSNRLYITSNNNCPINLIKIDTKNIKHNKEKEDINNFPIQNENANLLNTNFFANNNTNNNENKCEINFGIFKNNFIENKNRKDSLVSDFSFYGNLNSFIPELNNNYFNTGIV